MRLGLLWTLGALSGALGALLLYDAVPGINWTIWTVVAIAGLLYYRKPDAAAMRELALPLGFALVLAIGVAVTASGLLLFAALVCVASLLALAVVLSPDRPHRWNYGAVEIVTAPLVGWAMSMKGAVSAVATTVDSMDATRKHPALRGSLIAAPVVIALMLLFAAADPLLARGRDAVYGVFSNWNATPRLIFGVLLTLFVMGAYVASEVATRVIRPAQSAGAPSRIGLTERRIVLIAAAAVSWLFVLLQISYLFGTLPSIVGSGVTFAEYAHRGFGELTIAATGVALLIVAAHGGLSPRDRSPERRVFGWTCLALIAAVCCILFSAFHRITVYEDAYGYTTLRVYVQAYLILTLVILVTLAWHVSHRFDTRALARSVMTASLTTLAVMIFWNGDAWVTHANVQRYTRTGKLDVGYLANRISPDAYPALIQSLPAIAEPERTKLMSALKREVTALSPLPRPGAWYEWNLRLERARSAIAPIVKPDTQIRQPSL